MLHIQNITYRIAGRTLLEGASAHLPKGHRGALVGRNGIGKTTLFKLILNAAQTDEGEVSTQRGASVGIVAQEVPGGAETPLEHVLKADKERTSLLAEAEIAQDPGRIADIQERLIEIDAYSAPARASKILAGLGFDEIAQNKPLSDFSGGWRMRVALAAVLFFQPDLLLLDEPTNHLDMEAALWLESFLKNYPHTLLMVSHDRHFINAIVDRVYHIHNLKIETYTGNYDFYEKTRREKLAHLQAQKDKQDKQKAHIQKFIDRFRAKSSKARQAQSRIKALERFSEINIAQDDPTLSLNFPAPEPLSPPLITLEKAATGYEDKVVLKNLNGRIDPDDRIALLGMNGNGKTTFARLLAGRNKVMTGAMQSSPKMRVGFFNQHQIEDLVPQETPFNHLDRLMIGKAEARVRARLGRFGFPQSKADTPVEKLSGGEKARLVFCLISYHEPHLVILDEPTNHLDVETRESLVMAINAFEGAIILITHDWHLLELTANRLWLVENQTVQPFEGTLEDYKAHVLGGPKTGQNTAKKNNTRAAEIKAKKQKKKQQAKKITAPKGGKKKAKS